MKEISVPEQFEMRSGHHRCTSNLYPRIDYLVYNADALKLYQHLSGVCVTDPAFGFPRYYKGDDLDGKHLLYFAIGNYRDLLFDAQVINSLRDRFPASKIDVVTDMDVFMLFRQYGFDGGWQKYPVPLDYAEKYDFIFSNEFIHYHPVIPGKKLLNRYKSLMPADLRFKTGKLSLNPAIEKVAGEKNMAEPSVAIHVGSENRISNYPVNGYKKLIRMLSNRGIRVTLTGFSIDMEDFYPVPGENYIGRHASILETLAVLSHADIIISSDSFAARAGGLLNKSVIVLLNTNDPDAYSSFPSVKTISSKECCVPCYRSDKCSLGYKDCEAFNHDSISPEKIFETVISLLRKHPSLDALLLKAREYLNRGKAILSLQTLEEAAKIAPNNPASYIRAAAIMRQLGRKKEWLSLLDRARSCAPTYSRPLPDHNHKSYRNTVRSDTGSPGRVLLLASKTGMVFNDCVHGFEKLGWEPISELFGNGSHEGPEAHERLALKIRASEPHLVLSINHVGCDAEGFILSSLKHAGIPVVIWYVDNPFALLPEDNFEMVKDASLLACFDASYVDMLRKKTGVSAVHLPLGANPERFRPANGFNADQTWDISFVGNAGLDMAKNQRTGLDKLHPSMTPLIDTSIKRMGSSFFGPVRPLLKTSAQSMGITWEEIPSCLQEQITMVTESHASALKRIHMVCRLREFNIKVIGDLEWQPYLNQDQLYPPVDYLNGLCKIYRKSLINLNISRFQLRSGVTQRVFDVPATRGFLLTDRTSELNQYLQPGKEVAVYENADEAKEKVRYYLFHENEREEIASRAYQRVINEHTYAHRINKLLNILGPL